jgi:hypothetical protein
MKRMFLVMALSLMFLGQAPVKADTLQQYIVNQIETLNGSLEQNDVGVCQATPKVRQEAWLFRRFFFRLRPRVVLTAGIAKIGIVPDIELLWERTLPEGWTNYAPATR